MGSGGRKKEEEGEEGEQQLEQRAGPSMGMWAQVRFSYEGLTWCLLLSPLAGWHLEVLRILSGCSLTQTAMLTHFSFWLNQNNRV